MTKQQRAAQRMIELIHDKPYAEFVQSGLKEKFSRAIELSTISLPKVLDAFYNRELNAMESGVDGFDAVHPEAMEQAYDSMLDIVKKYHFEVMRLWKLLNDDKTDRTYFQQSEETQLKIADLILDDE